MRRLWWLIFLWLFILPKNVYAADKTAGQYYQDFLQNYRRYQVMIDPLKTQKSRYLTYKTVETQIEYLNSAKNFTQGEINAINSYTLFVKTILAEATKVLNYEEAYPYLMLDDEVSFLNVSEGKLKGLNSLSELEILLTDLSSHYKKIGLLGFQVKSIIEVFSAKRNLENIKIEADKIEVLLSESKLDPGRIAVAKDNFLSLKKDLSKAEDLIKQAGNKLKNNTKSSDYDSLSKEIRKEINDSVILLNKVVLGYKNIISGIK